MIVKNVRRSRSAERVDAEAQPGDADITLPPESRARLDGAAQHMMRQQIVLIGLRLRIEMRPAGHGDDIRADALLLQQRGGGDGDLDLGAGGDQHHLALGGRGLQPIGAPGRQILARLLRSEEHTSELQSLMRSSYAVFCLKKTNAY